jgi:hypothetical protein
VANILERDVEKAVKDYAKKLGWKSYKWKSSNERGVPDRLFLRTNSKGEQQLVMVEFKKPGEGLRKDQEVVHNELREIGFSPIVIDDIDDGKWFFAEHTN